MKDDDGGLVVLLVVAGLVLLGVLGYRRGLFAGIFGPAPQVGGYPQPFPGGLGPNEIGPAAPGGGGSTFGNVCNYVATTTGRVAQQSPDPRAQAVGVAVQVGGPAICAAHEWAAKATYGAVKSGAQVTAGAVKTGAKAVGSGVKSAYNNTLGRLF